MRKKLPGSDTLKNWVHLSVSDNVVVITHSLPKGTKIEINSGVILQTQIDKGHKVAVQEIQKGQPIFKFGHIIGVATSKIAPGQHVHVHNVTMPPPHLIGFGGGIGPQEHHLKWNKLPAYFMGYRRSSGPAGIRNYVVVVSSVNCSATVTKAVCQHFKSAQLKKYGIDGIVPITHASGCAQEIGGESYQVLNRTLAGWVFHPNVVGAVVIGLGCEGTTFKSILRTHAHEGTENKIPLENFNIQDVGGTARAIETGIASVKKVLKALPKFKRTKLPASELGLALNCGGSDAFSSLTANPALGLTSDILISKGGMVSLAEIPECTGAEELLYNRSQSDEVRKKLKETFAWWEDYAKRQKVELNSNLAPGNIAGGITTIVEKSLGSVAKGGSTGLTEVVNYSEKIHKKGFTIMNTPGFDPVSVTGLVAGGCQMVAFTTGRGSVFGCAIAPTIKIATTSDLFNRMSDDMDVDAGRVLIDGRTEPVALAIYKLILEVASGKKTCSEKLGLGWEEFVPWPIGETL